MKKLKRGRKIVFRFFLIITISFLVLLAILSPLVKFLVEKYDVKYTGREITMDYAYVNIFTGYVYFSNIKINEAKSDSVFFKAKGVSANFTLFKILGGTYEISDLVIDNPIGKIIQDKQKNLNFNDLIERWTPKKVAVAKEPVHFSIKHINIINGRFYYIENNIPVNYNLKKVNIDSRGFSWNTDTIGANFSFISGIGKGGVKGKFVVNTNTIDYKMAIKATGFDLVFIEQYLKDFINFGEFRANFDADVKATGNFKDAQNIYAKGYLAINEFHIGKTNTDDYAAFKKLKFVVDELSPKFHRYKFDSILLDEPFVKYELYDKLDNIQAMFGKEGGNVSGSVNAGGFNLIVEIAKYVQKLSINFLHSNYHVNKFALNKGNFIYNDYCLGEKFSVAANPLTIVADSVSKSHKRIKIALQSGITPYGTMVANLSMNPKDSSDFDFSFKIQKVAASLLNPYLIAYTSFPLDRGTIEFRSNWHVVNGNIQSNNHLLIIDPRIASRIHNKDASWIPLRFIMFLVRETGNVIDYEIPITGNLKDPLFHWRDVFKDLLSNIVLKPPTTVYRGKVRNLENEIERSVTLRWKMNCYDLNRNQKKFLGKAKRFLKENPDAKLFVNPFNYSDKEREYIVLFEAKKKYFLWSHKIKESNLTKRDSFTIVRMSIKDSSFNKYLNDMTHDAMLFTVQSKSQRLCGGIVEIKYHELKKLRLNAFMEYFKDDSIRKRVNVVSSSTGVPYNGFSVYSIKYKGEIPSYLLKAQNKMNELDDESPRKMFRKYRGK